MIAGQVSFGDTTVSDGDVGKATQRKARREDHVRGDPKTLRKPVGVATKSACYEY